MSKKGIEDLKKEYEEIRMSELQVEDFKKSIARAKKDNRRVKRMRGWKVAGTAVAAVIIAFIILPNTSVTVAHAMEQIPLIGNVVKVVTFRDYNYESDRQLADIKVPKLETAEVTEEDNGIALTELSGEGGAVYEGESSEASPVAYTLEHSVDEINYEIDELTGQIIAEFEENARETEGYQEVIVSHEVICTTEQYFTLKLTHYMGAGSGTQWNYYYTIDLITGERMTLADLFVDGADYIVPISDEIKRQMREQMAEDENKHYWLDDEIEEWNFREITPDTQFYINENNNLVISFNEGDVAPMYMGVVTFEIPAEVLDGIRK